VFCQVSEDGLPAIEVLLVVCQVSEDSLPAKEVLLVVCQVSELLSPVLPGLALLLGCGEEDVQLQELRVPAQ
jgi:hypothetical protein